MLLPSISRRNCGRSLRVAPYESPAWRRDFPWAVTWSTRMKSHWGEPSPAARNSSTAASARGQRGTPPVPPPISQSSSWYVSSPIPRTWGHPPHRCLPQPAPQRPLLPEPVSYTHLRAHETDSYLVCRLLL